MGNSYLLFEVVWIFSYKMEIKLIFLLLMCITLIECIPPWLQDLIDQHGNGKPKGELKFPVLKRGKLLETLPTWGKSFKIEADITVEDLPKNGYANIFRFTKGGKTFREYGTRIPALWIHGWKAKNRG